MKKHLVLLVTAASIIVGSFCFAVTGGTQTNTLQQAVAAEIIALEKASVEAWKRRDKAFYADYWADGFTMFLPPNPYLDADAKANTLSRFEQKTEEWKLLDLQIYNPRVQVYGDVALLTYNEAVEGLSSGRPTSYTGKVTMIYHRQGGKWRGVHYHESENRATR